MKAFHYEAFKFSLPESHRFPVRKYTHLSDYLVQQAILAPGDLHIPEAASYEQLALVHSPEYLDKVLHGKMSEKEVRRLGLPWSSELVERARRSVGSTIAACRVALQEGMCASLGGGTHHAYPDHGEGFCLFNDVAVAVRTLQAEGTVQRVMILDCDVHQGNGTAVVFQADPSVFTFSIHGAKNFPFHKEDSDLDIALPDGAGDEVYLSALDEGLKKVFSAHVAQPYDLAVYLAGADPYYTDRFGRMTMSKAGLAQRDRIVLERCSRAYLPVAVTMSGGYAADIADIVHIHAETVRIARELWFKKWSPAESDFLDSP